MRVLETLTDWARKVSGWAELQDSGMGPGPDSSRLATASAPGDLIYRLRHWPTLPSAMRTADVLRLLSLMSSRPVSRSWMLAHSRLPARRIEALLDRLTAQGALEEINPASYPSEPRVSRR